VNFLNMSQKLDLRYVGVGIGLLEYLCITSFHPARVGRTGLCKACDICRYTRITDIMLTRVVCTNTVTRGFLGDWKKA